MRTLFAAVACCMLVAAVGCDKNKDHNHMDKSTMKHETMATMDACAHCPGVQVATADGKCPVCGAKVAPAK